MRRIASSGVLLAVLIALAPARAQQPPLVRFTPAVDHAVRGSVRLPGNVESRTASVVAAEASGLVVALEVREGQRVERGQALARLRTSFYEAQLHAAQGLLKEATARLDLAQSKLRRAEELFDQRIISQDDLDDAVSEYAAWQGRDDQSRAEIERLQLVLEHCTVRAPFAGVVVRERCEVGEWIALGGPVVELVAPDALLVNVEVPERYYDLLSPGVEVRVRFEALPGLDLPGNVERVIPSAVAQARTFPVKVAVDNPGGRIGIGMLAEVALPVGDSVQALIVPKDAIVRDGDDEFVYRIDAEDKVEQVAVHSAAGAGAWVVVDGKVAAGDRVVTRGNERLRGGQSVRGEPLEYDLP